MKKPLIFVMLLCLVLAPTGCSSVSESTESEIECFEEITEEVIGYEIDPDAEFCMINGQRIEFMPTEDLKKLEEPLIRLLENELRPYGERGEIMGYSCPYPDRPAIEQSSSCALFDVTGDGIPELLIHPLGYFGSSGYAEYFVYDVYTGERLGSLEDGMGIPWCAYYNLQDGQYYLMVQYYRRGGWPYRSYSYIELAYDDSKMGGYYGHAFAGSSHDIDMVESTDSEGNIYIEEIYPSSRYYSEKYGCNIDGQYASLCAFERYFIRIPETELRMIAWNDVSENIEDLHESAVKMTAALISTDVKTVKPMGNLRLHVYVDDIED